MGCSWMAIVNALLYGLQQYVNRRFGRFIGAASRRHPTLITPAPYAFAIWGVIYTLLTLTVVVDIFCPSISFYAQAKHPTFLRVLFAISCVASAAWVVVFTNDDVNVATGVLVVLWMALAALYLAILVDRQQRNSVEFLRFVLSELGVTIYFAWTCAATLISVAVSAQDIMGRVLDLPAYLVLLGLLIVASITAITYGHDIMFGAVAVWALTAVSVKQLHLDEPIQTESNTIRANAALGASVILAMMVISIVHRCYVRCSLAMNSAGHGRGETSAPILNDKDNYPTYGTSV